MKIHDTTGNLRTTNLSMPLERGSILKLMPNSPNWVLIDRVLEYRPSTYIRTQKCINDSDPFVKDHFLNGPSILPGVLLIEYVSQSAYLLDRLASSSSNELTPVHLLARCSASFLSPAQGGDILIAEVNLIDRVRDVGVFEGIVSCGDRLVCRVNVFGAPQFQEPIYSMPHNDSFEWDNKP